ncbi:MAG TPA: nuclear transport factor 2 family protein [Gemmatimonadales bacterium]|nr:nuclear transport factor 2 family protein [Gemmatimonadales bacterium]
MRRSIVLLFALALGGTASASAQATTPAPDRAADSAAVLAVVHRVFDAMRSRDSALLRTAFAEDARLFTPGMRDGAPVVHAEPINGFIEAVGQPSDSTWDERIYGTEVRLDGGLATVWTEYDFFLGSKFLHCGVDAFQLARYPDGWKITSLGDTRQREGCPKRQ